MKRKASVFKNGNIMLWLTKEIQDYGHHLGHNSEIMKKYTSFVLSYLLFQDLSQGPPVHYSSDPLPTL